MTDLNPWQWVICDTSPDAYVHDAGTQHTRLLSPAADVAAERLLVYAYNLLLAGNTSGVGHLICRVRRVGASEWEGHAAGDRLPLPTATALPVNR